MSELEQRKFYRRSSSYIRYNGTKHDGHRRAYATVNPIPYFNICTFLSEKWSTFERAFSASKLSVGSVRLGKADEDRAVVVPTLSERSDTMSAQIGFSPYVLKTDIAQFYPSIYTHTIAWVAHGRELAKQNQSRDSKIALFNGLDWFTQQCQSAQTRGVAVGPDAFRVIAEYIGCDIDRQLIERTDDLLVGGVRHVDDFYLGVRTQIDATVVLSHLRDILQRYELQINDSKTKILSGLDPVDDIWAQELRKLLVRPWDEYSYALDKAHDLAKSLNSQSPVKLMLRRFDVAKCYRWNAWQKVEAKLQRILWHYEHCTDYVCLLLAKRFAIEEPYDTQGWSQTVANLISSHLSFNHHHEIAWLLWVAFVCKLDIPDALIERISTVQNSHIKAILIAAYQKGLLRKKPGISMGSSLSTTDENWLHNLVGRSLEYSRASFSGEFSDEFKHLADKAVELINFDKHILAVAEKDREAISSSKYGYDAPDEDNQDYYDPDDLDPFGDESDDDDELV